MKMMNQEVRQIMTKDPVVAHPNQNIRDVSDMMIENRLQQLPVIDSENKLLGMITSYDLWRGYRSSEEVEDGTVKDYMTTTVIKITPLDKVGTAAELFMDRRFKTLPVVNLRNELKGVVTVFDVIKQTLIEEYPRPILYPEVFEESV